MNRSFLIAVAFSAAVTLSGANALAQVASASGAAPAAAAVTRPMLPEDPAVTRRAMEWFGRFQNGAIDRTQLASSVDAKLTPQALDKMKRQLAPLGAPAGIAYGGARDVKGELVYRYVVVFPVGAIQEYMSVDKVGKITGVLFLPIR